MRYILFCIILIFSISSCNSISTKTESMKNKNPLIGKFDTPFEVPPFDKITSNDYYQAFETGINEQNNEISAIINGKEEPDFVNTIEALEKSGSLIKRTNTIFQNLLSANTNIELQKLATKIAPRLSSHYDNILMNEHLFKKIQKVYNDRNQLTLDTEQKMLLKKTYQKFVRGGAELNENDKEQLKEINSQLSILSLHFGDHVLDDNNNFRLHINEEKDLSGLPESIIEAAKETAKGSQKSDSWGFTLDKPSLIPFLQFSNNRELRKRMFQGYIMRGDNNNQNDNKEIVEKMVNLRLQKAKLLGYDSYADYVLEQSMAKTPEQVFKLLGQITPQAMQLAEEEASELQKMATKDGIKRIQPWDWWYYTEKLRQKKYNLNEEELRPYFSLDDAKKGLFDVLKSLYGIQFIPNNQIPVYQKDVEAYEVKEANGKLIGILYMDFFPRPSKQGGAWMTSYRKQRYENEKNIIPVISVNFNFTKPTATQPALLSFDEVETLFHECGHAMHGLFSDCQYESLSGTAVPRDFVEMPSQIMENWASEPEVLKSYAKNYKTGETIPDSLIKKMQESGRFNLGFTLTEYLAASYLDMDWHTLSEPFEQNVNTFESEAMKKIHLISEIEPRYRSTYFNHIFSGGYAAGYYSYVWAEVLDADAFQSFLNTSLFDKETAERFRNEVLSKGGTDEPENLFRKFKGRDPDPKAYMQKKGLQ
ncbi:MAG: M3 family metallopeptidase [Bacteroidales bacterium]|nr:M3 family metallopeptidase [Bacteroidales bacterium]